MVRAGRFAVVPMLAAVLVPLGCGPGSTPDLLRAFSTVVIVEVAELGITGSGGTARVLLEWNEQTPEPCVEHAGWQSGQHSVTVLPDGPCGSRSEEGRPQQWMRMETSPGTLESWMGQGKGGLGLPPGRIELRASVAGRALRLGRRAQPRIRLAPDLRVRMAGNPRVRAAELVPISLLPPVVELRVWFHNPVPVDLEVIEGSYSLRSTRTVLASGPLVLPPRLLAGEDVEVAVQLGAIEGAGAALLGVEALLAAQSLTVSCSVTIRSPWGRAVVETTREVLRR
jgi:hypothetical protein